jgi:hypothetical protein
MNDGRRQGLLKPPKQLVHPGAAKRLPSASERHKKRDMRRAPPLPRLEAATT